VRCLYHPTHTVQRILYLEVSVHTNALKAENDIAACFRGNLLDGRVKGKRVGVIGKTLSEAFLIEIDADILLRTYLGGKGHGSAGQIESHVVFAALLEETSN
jgi:hypothetical protein